MILGVVVASVQQYSAEISVARAPSCGQNILNKANIFQSNIMDAIQRRITAPFVMSVSIYRNVNRKSQSWFKDTL